MIKPAFLCQLNQNIYIVINITRSAHLESLFKSISATVGFVLSTAPTAFALPCAESYVEYREKMLLKGWKSVRCSEEMHVLYPDSYREVCVEVVHNWTTAVAYWKTPEGWRYADPGAPPRLF